MYFYDLRIRVNIILFVFIIQFFYTKMTQIVDTFFEFLHSISGEFFIRIFFNDYVKYVDNSFIFSSDFIIYNCDNHICKFRQNIYFNQIVFFNRNQKRLSIIFDAMFLQIRPIKIERIFVCEKNRNDFN